MSKFLDLDSEITINGPLIAFADSRPIVAPAPFADAVEHWRFGTSEASRNGLIAARRMALGIAPVSITGGTGYSASPTVTLSGPGATGLSAVAQRSGTAISDINFTGQPADAGAVTATITDSSGTGGAASIGRGVEPTYNAKSAVIAAGRQNGLISDIDDALTYSEAYLIKRPTAGVKQMVGGSVQYSGFAGGSLIGGDGFFWDTANVMRLENVSGASMTLAPPASWIPGAFGVLIASVAPGAMRMSLFGPDGVATNVANSSSKQLANPQRKRALGGIHYGFESGSPYRALEIASFVNWAYALNTVQMQNCAFDLLDYARDGQLI